MPVNKHSIFKKKHNLDNLKTYVTQYNEPELIFITETWLYEDEINYYNIEQYKPYFNCREKRGGGSALYVRNDIEHEGFGGY